MTLEQEEQKRLDAAKVVHEQLGIGERFREESREIRRKELRSMDIQQLLAELLIHIEEHGIDVNSY